MFNNYSNSDVRKLVDKYFSLQWCRDNLVVPLTTKKDSSSEEETVILAIANYSYLGTIASPIKERLSQVIMDAMSSIDIDLMTQNEKLKLIQIGLTYVIPRLKQVENIEGEMPREFQIEIIDSLSKYSNKYVKE